MKKSIFIVIVFIIIVLLVGCSTNNNNSVNNQDKSNNITSNIFNNKNSTTDTINLSINYNTINDERMYKTDDGSLYYALGRSIYKLEKNQTTPEIIYTCNKKLTSLRNFVIKENYIYLSDYNDSSECFSLYKIKLNTPEDIFLIYEYPPNGMLRVYNNEIYLSNEYKFDEKSENNFIQFYDKNTASGFTVNYVNDEIFFFDEENNENGIFKMTINGENKEKIFDGRADYMIVDEEWIYFQNQEDPHNSLYRMKKDGSNIQKLIGEQVHHMNKIGDWLYCSLKINDISGIYKIKTDGSEYQLLKECNGVSYINIIDEWLYYPDEDDNIRKMKLDGSEDQIFAEIEKQQ